MKEKTSNENVKKIPKKIIPGHNMTKVTRGLGRPILEGRYCGIREIPDFMEIEPAKATGVGL